MAASGTATGPTLKDLLARFRAEGRAADLAEIFDRTAPDLFRLALHLCPDAATAEDVLQETFLAVLEHASTYETGRPALPWLNGILRNQAGSARRRAARRPDPGRLDRPAAPDDPAAAAESAEEREALHEAMRRLPEPYRGVALLRWRYGLEPAQIADVKGVPPGTVWSWLHRALARLKVEMGALPALLLAFRPERGLDGVRRAVLRRAAAKAATASAAGVSAASVATMGGLVMANKAIAAVAAVVLLAGAGWLAFRPEPEPPPPPGPEVAKATAPSSTPAASPPKSTTPPKVEEALPDPVDLSKCDRDLDLFGVVEDAEGKPVAGASVEVLFRVSPDIRVLPSSARADRTLGPSTRSATDGTFAIRLARGTYADLRVRAEGFPETFFNWRCAGEKVRLVLRKGASLVVLAKDSGGKPVAGAIVSLLFGRDETGSFSFCGEAATGEDGRCAFEGVRSGGIGFWVVHPIHGMATLVDRTVPDTGTLTVEAVLPGGRTVRGRVTDALTGKPIAGATVAEFWMMRRPVLTDADGRYEKQGVPPKDTAELCADAEGYARDRREGFEGDTVDFALRPGDVVTGRVLAASGEPAAGVAVAAIGALQDRRGLGVDAREGTADTDGRFRIGGLRHDIGHMLVASIPGSGRLLKLFPPAPEEGGVLDLGDVRMPHGRILEGVLLDAEETPLPDRAVTLQRAGQFRFEDTYTREIARRTDDLGRFRFHGIAPGIYTVATANVPGQTPASAEVRVPEDRDVLDVRLKVPAGGSLKVLVTDEEGKPLEGIAVNVTAEAAHRSARTDAEGRAAFEGLPKGQVQVMAWDVSRPRRWVADSVRPVAATPEGQEIRIVLHEAGWIRGRVLGPDGVALADMQVSIRYSEEPYGQIAISGADGSFEASVPKGKPVVVEMKGYRMVKGGPRQERTPFVAEPQEVTPPVEGVEIRATAVEANRSITVRLVDLEGRPLQGFSITIIKEGQRMYPTTDANGEVTVEGLFAEEIGFGAFPPGVAPGQPSPIPEGSVLPGNVRAVPEGQTVTLRLRKGVPLGGIVYDSAGHPAEKASVTVQTEDYATSIATTDASGRFRVWVAPGLKVRYATATLLGPSGPAETKQLQGADLEKPELEFHLEPYKGR